MIGSASSYSELVCYEETIFTLAGLVREKVPVKDVVKKTFKEGKSTITRNSEGENERSAALSNCYCEADEQYLPKEILLDSQLYEEKRDYRILAGSMKTRRKS